MTKSLRFRLLVLAAVLSPNSGYGAPCCGGSSLLPSLVTGDDSAILSVTTSLDGVRNDVLPDGTSYVRGDDNIERTQTLKLSGAYRWADRWQSGVDIPLMRRYVSVAGQDATDTGLGDIGLNLGYEILPELSYSAWKPRGFLFARWLVPTGRSIYESSDPLGTDNFGKGFHALSLGTVLVKTWRSFDFLLEGEGHWTLARTFVDATGNTTRFHSGWGASGLAAVGYSPGKGAMRIGTSLSPVYDAARTLENASQLGNTDSQLAWTLSFQASYQWSDEWTSTLSYADQTILGGAHNVTLSRTITLLILRRFPL